MTSACTDLDTAVAPEGGVLRRKTRNCSSTSWRRPGSRREPGGRSVYGQWRGGDRGESRRRSRGHRVRQLLACGCVCARNALTSGAYVEVHLGSWARAVEFGPYDLVVCNPPYVPRDPAIGRAASRRRSDRRMLGMRGRRPSCPRPVVRGSTRPARRRRHAAAGAIRIRRTARDACGTASVGLDSQIIAYQWIPFGPVLSSRAEWLEDTGRLSRAAGKKS